MMIRTMSDVYKEIRNQKQKTLAVAQAADAHVLEAVLEAYQDGYVLPVLVGNEKKIGAVAEKHGMDLQGCQIHHVEDDSQAALAAVRLVTEHKADIIMKGMMESADFLKAVLDKTYGLRQEGAVISTIAAVSLKKLNRFIFITDPGFTPVPDKNMKIKLIENAVSEVQKFGIKTPKVALLSASERANPKMPASVEAEEIQQMYMDGVIKDCQVAGPISFDLALSDEAVKQKGYDNPVGGCADILVVPSLEVGNVLYKSLSYFAEMETGGIMTGAKAPIVFTSRADSAETKKNTLALAIFLAEKKR